MVSEAKRGVVHPLVMILGCARSVQHGQHSQRQLGHPNHAGLQHHPFPSRLHTCTHTHLYVAHNHCASRHWLPAQHVVLLEAACHNRHHAVPAQRLLQHCRTGQKRGGKWV